MAVTEMWIQYVVIVNNAGPCTAYINLLQGMSTFPIKCWSELELDNRFPFSILHQKWRIWSDKTTKEIHGEDGGVV